MFTCMYVCTYDIWTFGLVFYVLFRKFDRVRREREVDIADKLIKEEEHLKQMKEKLNQPHWKPRDSSMPTKPQVCPC